MDLQIDDVSISIGGRDICDGITLSVSSGKLLGLVGPNGSGKTTLLRSIYRMLKPRLGQVIVGEADLWTLSPREAARRIAVVVQEPLSDFQFSVADAVAMGRTPHKGAFERDTAVDVQLVVDALERVGIEELAARRFGTLSGGEKQRALIARALVQQARLLILDEPTNHLDLRYQLEILQLVRDLGLTSVMAIHDVNLADRYCDQVALLSGGEVQAVGPTYEVLHVESLSALFDVDVEIAYTPSGRRLFAFERNHEKCIDVQLS